MSRWAPRCPAEQPRRSPRQPPPPSFAAVVADLPQPAFSAFAAAALLKLEELKASIQHTLDHGMVLAAAKAALVLLEGVMPKLLRLARFADDVPPLVGASAADAGLRASIQDALLALHRPNEMAPARRPRRRRPRRKGRSPGPAPPTTLHL